MTESEATLDGLMKLVRDELIELFCSENVHADTIAAKINEIKKTYGSRLGHVAEFWLLLAVGMRLVKPLPINGHVSSIYIGKAYSAADKCDSLSEDAYEAMQRQYMEMLITQLQNRSNRSASRVTAAKAAEYERAAEIFEREYARMFNAPVSTS